MKQENSIRFCTQCGQKLKRKTFNMQQCVHCGFEAYDIPKTSTQIVLENDKGEILFLRRARDPYRGMLNTPGGFVDVGETAEEAVQREVKEETGIQLKEVFFIGSYVDHYLYKGVNFPILSLAFAAHIGKSKIKISNESIEFLFCPKNKLPLKDIAIKSDIQGIQDYLKKFDKKSK